DLRLPADREARFELRAEILSAVALVVDLRLDEVMEVLVLALGEQMAGRAAADDDAVLDLPESNRLALLRLADVGGHLAVLVLLGLDALEVAARRIVHLPAGEILAVEELRPAFVRLLLVVARGQGRSRDEQDEQGDDDASHGEILLVNGW